MKTQSNPRGWRIENSKWIRVHGSIFYLLSSIFVCLCAFAALREASAQNSGPYVVMPGTATGGFPTYPSAGVAGVATNIAPRLGFVGNNTAIDTENNSGNTEFMEVGGFANTSGNPVGYIQLVLQDFYDSGSGLAGPGGNAYATAAIGYPSNAVPTRVTFNGATSGTITNGTYLVSDLVKLSTPIPPGAIAYYRSFYSNGVGGIVFTGLANSNYNWAAYGTSVSDSTGVSGVAGVTPQGYRNAPIAIIGYTARPSILMFGDSRLAGEGEGIAISGQTVNLDVNPSLGQSRIPDSEAFGSANMGVPSESWSTWAVNDQQLLYFTNYATAVYMELGINDLFVNSETAAYVENNYSTFSTNLPFPLYTCTEEPRTASVDGWSTLWGQTINQSGDANRVAFNQALRNNLIGGIAGYLDLAACVESATNSGLWAVDGVSNYLTPDGIHCSVTGAKLEASSIVDFFNGSHAHIPTEGGVYGGSLPIQGGIFLGGGSIVMRSNTFTVFALTNGLNNGDARLLWSNGPSYTGAWVSCLWSNGVPITNYVAGSGGNILP